MSLASWYVMLTKLWDQRKLQDSPCASSRSSSGPPPSVKDGVERLKKGDEFRCIAEDGLRAASHHDGRLTDRIDLHEWITMSLQRAVDERQQQAARAAWPCWPRSARPPRSSACSARSWGILNALIAIGIAGQASIDKVAGPVGEALIMTAIGLFVAVPAVMGYNWLLGRQQGPAGCAAELCRRSACLPGERCAHGDRWCASGRRQGAADRQVTAAKRRSRRCAWHPASSRHLRG